MVSSSTLDTTGAVGTHVHRGMDVAGDGTDGGVSLTAATVTPTDRVRWGPILAGLFVALSALVVLSVLGAAVAGSTYDPGDRARTYGIGAGVWGGVSMLVAFLIGGCVAARSAAVRGRHNGVLNGFMVWAVAVPLMIYLASAAVGAAGRAAGTVAQTGAMAANAAAQSDPAAANQAADQARAAIDRATQSPDAQPGALARRATDPVNQERAADALAWGAWSTLVALLLSLGAATIGGYLGARMTDRDGRAVIAGPATA